MSGQQLLTRFASSLSGRLSPKAFKRVVRFFLGSGLDKARIIGLCGFVKNRITCKNGLLPSPESSTNDTYTHPPTKRQGGRDLHQNIL